MDEIEYNGFDVYFSELSDPRISRKKLYPLIEILFVVLCGSICGAEISCWAKAQPTPG
jgi:DDE_Tnp_1-associated